MKLFNGKEDSMYLTRKQWTKLFVAFSIMVLALYVIAMICSLCGSKYFILNYQNEQMDRIEKWFREHDIYALLSFVFMTIESSIVISFTLRKFAKFYHILSFYFVNVILALIFKNSFQMIFTFSQIVLSIGFIFLDNILTNKKLVWKKLLFTLIRFVIAIGVTLILQAMIIIIKAGYFDGVNHILKLSGFFIYSIEYDIALSVLLVTLALLIDREKGDSKLWVMAQVHGGSSQTSKMQSQKSNTKNKLTKTQKNKLRLLYAKIYLIQICAFLLVMVLPFLLGKVFEFLVMYFAFCVARYILGFNYSLHYKKEVVCITVGVIVFGILSLAVPFFYVVMIIAVSLGIGLAILLHLSYKYKGFYLFSRIAKPDKFALLYTFFDGDISERHVKIICNHKGLDKFQTQIIWEFMQGNKMSYIAFKHNYSQRMMIYKLDETIDKLIH